MSNKVAHVTDEAHALAMKYCADNGMRMKEWVSDLILKSIDGRALPVEKPEPEVKLRPVVKTEPVKKVARRSIHGVQETGDEPWSRPPFWASERGAKPGFGKEDEDEPSQRSEPE